MGHLLDAEEDSLHLSRFTVFEIEELMRLGEKYALPVLLYLFRRIERLIQAQGGRPSAIFLDEAWLMLGHPVFRDKIYEWLKVLRKLNCFVFMATQSLSDAARSGILDVIAESTATKIYLPNPYAREESFSDLYINLGLNRRQINIIAEATPKKEYYMVTAKGRRLYELDLGPLALAFCASSDKETLVEIQQLEARYREDWVTHYLARKQLSLKDYKAAS
jgi:type IV secretion system protein VirB4